MKKLSLGSRKRPSSPVPQQRQQWRAYDDGPINLSARPAVDSATGQKAFVLAFAAVAVAGAAYFATVMVAPDDDPTAVVSRANARPQVEEQVAAVAAAPAPAPATPAARVQPVTQSAAPEPKPQPAAVAAADPAQVGAGGVFPAPVRVKTVSVPTAAKTPAAEAESAVVADDFAADPAAEVAGIDPTADAVTEPAAETTVVASAPVAAYATDDPLVSEGISAVMGVAAREKIANSPVAVRKKKNEADGETDVASTEPEMAGSGANTRRIRSGVNMRAAPKSGSQIIGTIPTNAQVSVAPGCKHWCSVSYNGKRGYIYKSFLR